MPAAAWHTPRASVSARPFIRSPLR
jgi:hypothetical protein